jgi:hypothetical protein
MLIFLHLPKTAGSTLAEILERQYTPRGIVRLYESSADEVVASLPPSGFAHANAIMGHFRYGVHRYVPGPTTYLTVLREPIDRVISHYYYVRNDPTHYLWELAQHVDLREFVVACGTQEPNNDQVRLLAGSKSDSVSLAHGRELLIAAEQHLRDHFPVVGLTEDFDRSILLMKRALGWRLPFYARRNVGKARPRKAVVSAEALDVIRTYNQFDLELYNYACDLLACQAKASGPSLTNELRRFKWLNRIYGPMYVRFQSHRTS